jgi:hypothetical protein
MSFLLDQKAYLAQQQLFPTPYNEAENLIIRSGIRFFNNNMQRIPYPVAYRYFKYYKLLFWSGQHIIESIEAGIICRDDIAFIVRFNKKQNLTRGYILNHKEDQYTVSFRAAKDEWNIDPVVYISLAP